MNTFPTLSAIAEIKGFGDQYSDDAVQRASFASGYPCMNEMFTFDPRIFQERRRNVSQTDKESWMAFYQLNKGVPFYWLNEQDNTVYEVVFVERPIPVIQGDDNKNLWSISQVLRQSSSTTLDATYITHQFYGGDAMIMVENLAAGVDIADRIVYAAGKAVVIDTVILFTQGTPVGIDDSNTVVLSVKDEGGHTLLTKTYNTASQPPTSDSVDLSSLLDVNYTTLAKGDILLLNVTCGATANMPGFGLILGGQFS